MICFTIRKLYNYSVFVHTITFVKTLYFSKPYTSLVTHILSIQKETKKSSM